jgi:hypothetical protein
MPRGGSGSFAPEGAEGRGGEEEVGFSLRPCASWEYDCFVRVKTSVTLLEELLVRLDRVDKNRSAVLEKAAVAYLALLDQQERDRRDIAIIDRNAKRLNREALETLEYQRVR